jgi:flagellar FliJ protein
MNGRFHFSLQSLLELHKRTEDRLKMDLSNKMRKLLDESTILEGYFEARKDHSEQLRAKMAKGMEKGVIELYQDFIRGTDERIKHAWQIISSIEDEIKKTRHSLAEASKKRKAMEKMKEKQWKAYLNALEKEERKLLDDTATRKYVDGLIQKDEISR